MALYEQLDEALAQQGLEVTTSATCCSACLPPCEAYFPMRTAGRNQTLRGRRIRRRHVDLDRALMRSLAPTSGSSTKVRPGAILSGLPSLRVNTNGSCTFPLRQVPVT